MRLHLKRSNSNYGSCHNGSCVAIFSNNTSGVAMGDPRWLESSAAVDASCNGVADSTVRNGWFNVRSGADCDVNGSDLRTDL